MPAVDASSLQTKTRRGANSRITNGILEGFNSIFQAAKAKARGYKKTETIKAIIYLLTAKLDFSQVNHYCSTLTL